jgi:hypothetical protein
MARNTTRETHLGSSLMDETRRLFALEYRSLSCLFLLALFSCNHSNPAGNLPSPEASVGDLAGLVEITQEVGLDFMHVAGEIDNYSMPQIMGSGAALFDYDGDDDLDILLINGGSADPSSQHQPAAEPAMSRLFRQDSGGSFVDVTQESQLANYGYGMGAAVGDIDNDGDLDVYITNYGLDRLFQNNGDGTFADVTESAGLANPRWGTAACFFDHDQDGWLDLFVVNYLDFFPGSICEDGGGRRDYCGPESFRGTADSLYRNTTGDSDSQAVAFVDVTITSGIASQVGRGLGVLCSDMNEDDRPDIYVANDMEPNRLWIQQADGSYRDEALLRGAAVNHVGRPEASMGLAYGDVNADGRHDLFVTHLRGETNTLYLVEQSGLFDDRTPASGLGQASLHHTGFGVAAVDLEHDGDLDLVIVNGRVKREPHSEANASTDHWAEYAETNQVFFNSGSGDFLENTGTGTSAFRKRTEVSRGLCWGDIDNDGDIDLLVTNAGGPARLYRNEFAKRGNWLTIRAVDSDLRRDSIGARVQVQVGDRQIEREVNPSSSYLSSQDLRVHFGLGDAPRYDRITIRWPGAGGQLEEFPAGETNRQLVLARGTGKTTGKTTQPSGQPE